jgi:hypothetical protein
MSASQLDLVVNQAKALPPHELLKLIRQMEEILKQKQRAAETDASQERYSFIGIGRSGQPDLSRRAEEILEQEADRREGWSLR